MSNQSESVRYKFLLGFLIEKGVLTNKRYNNGVWCLRGVYGVDDSGLRGAGRNPEEAIDNAIIADGLDIIRAEKFWNTTHQSINQHSKYYGMSIDEAKQNLELMDAESLRELVISMLIQQSSKEKI
jgi:hypothetical protein